QEWTANLDGNADGFVTEKERVEGLGAIFADQIYMAKLSGDPLEVHGAYAEALNVGIMWDGSTWKSTLDANGQPTQAAIDYAKKLGFIWSGSTWEADVD